MLKYPSGLSLLLTLFVLSAILVAALSAGSLILRELKITGTSDRGIQAFYAAESALENSLYDFRQLGETDLTIDESSAVELGQGRWWRASSKTVANLAMTLLANQVTEVALFDPDNSVDQARSIGITWSNDPAVCPGADFTWLEVVQSYWNVMALPPESQSQRSILSPSDAGGVIVNLNPAGSYPYVRLRALFGDACNLTLNAFTGGGSEFALPAQLQVTATGEVGDARQALSITVPAHAPQFSAFDYTLFSEQAICKDVSPCN